MRCGRKQLNSNPIEELRKKKLLKFLNLNLGYKFK